MTTHVGTHIDSLGHFSIGEHLYGGHTIEDSVGDWGLLNLGIENVPPIISRGICLDVSRLDGGDHLEAGRAVTYQGFEESIRYRRNKSTKGGYSLLEYWVG